MKIIFNLLIALLLVSTAYSQVVETASGSSSVLMQNTNLGFNVGEAQLSLNTNSKIKLSDDFGINLGGNVSSKNKDGLGELFSSGDLNPSSQINFIAGVYISNSSKLDRNVLLTDKPTQDKEKKLDSILKIQINTYKQSIDGQELSDDDKDALKKVISDAMNAPVNQYILLVSGLKIFSNNPLNTTNARSVAKGILDSLLSNNNYITLMQIRKTKADNSNARMNLLKNKVYYRANFYLQGGVAAESFKLFNGWDTTNLSKSFSTENFQGGTLGGGINYRLGGMWLIGAKYSYIESNNSELLNSTDYNVTDTRKSGTTTYTSTDKVSAYSGNYGHIFLNRVDVDILSFFALDTGAFMILDGYCRNINSNNESLYGSHTDLGISSLYFKKNGNFMGGIYLELPDINENAAKQQDNFNSKVWYKRLSFGIYTKFSFNALLDKL